MPKEMEWISVNRAALRYGTTVERIRKLCKVPEFPCKKEKGSWVINASALDRLLDIKDFVEEEFSSFENGLDVEDLKGLTVFYEEESLDELNNILEKEIKIRNDLK